MEAIIFIGIQAVGKSTFYRQRFADTHLRINLDMLKTRHRERLLLEARARYIALVKAAQFRVIGYYFRSSLTEALQRNRQRAGCKVIPEKAIAATHGRLQLPSLDEGFDQLYYVTLTASDEFVIQEWADELR